VNMNTDNSDFQTSISSSSHEQPEKHFIHEQPEKHFTLKGGGTSRRRTSSRCDCDLILAKSDLPMSSRRVPR
jgi:hypothetical protein